MSKPFRRALLVEKGYEQIIYHANYNPRTIEMITGLAKRWDESVAPDNYVDYAVPDTSAAYSYMEVGV